jgi:hypothetical protein
MRSKRAALPPTGTLRVTYASRQFASIHAKHKSGRTTHPTSKDVGHHKNSILTASSTKPILSTHIFDRTYIENAI